MITFIEDLATYGFLQRAVIVSVLTGVIAGVIGCFVMLRGLSMLGDAISHAVVPGVAIAYMLGLNFFVGAAVTGLLSAFGIGIIQRRSGIKQDTAIAIILSATFALGILLITRARSAIDLTQILFGNVLAVRIEDFIISLIVGVVVLAVVIVLYKELLVSSFDPATAEVYGFKASRMHFLVLVLLTLVTVASLQTVGVVLVISLLVTPAATAYLLVRRLPPMMLLSGVFGASAAFIGMLTSLGTNLPSGPVIALVSAIGFTIAWLVSPRRRARRVARLTQALRRAP